MKRKLNLFNICNISFFSLIGMVSVIPYLHLVAKSFSSTHAVSSGSVSFWPIGFHAGAYKYVLTESYFFNALTISALVTLTGTALALFTTVMCAYALSRVELPGRKFFMLLVICSMLFYGGIVPSYMLMRALGLINTQAAMVIPYMFTPFNMFVVKTFFEDIPESIMESARMDGAGNFRILWRIVLPISLPVLATIGLYYAVSFWNDYFHPALFITRRELKPLQIFLYELINSSGDAEEISKMQQMPNVTYGNVQAASIIVATVPILALYPFLQKYFVHGLTVGSVKG